MSDVADNDDFGGADNEQDDDDVDHGGSDDAGSGDGGNAGNDGTEQTEADSQVGRKRKRVIATELEPEKLAEFNAAERRRGVLYIPRLPPFMKPIKIRHLLERYGEIGRIYLAPEDPAVYRRRIKSGGNKKVMYTEGWVEFADKHVAKATAQMLHNTPVGDNKRGFYSSDLWNIKYLKHFKWHHLTEKISYEKRIRAIQLRTELAHARKEADRYVQRAESAKNAEHRDKRLAKQGKLPPASSGAGAGSADAAGDESKIRRTFRQLQPASEQ